MGASLEVEWQNWYLRGKSEIVARNTKQEKQKALQSLVRNSLSGRAKIKRLMQHKVKMRFLLEKNWEMMSC